MECDGVPLSDLPCHSSATVSFLFLNYMLKYLGNMGFLTSVISIFPHAIPWASCFHCLRSKTPGHVHVAGGGKENS